MAGALRRPARDRALPQPRRGPVRPAPAHALRRPRRRRPSTTRSRAPGGSGTATAVSDRRCGPASWSPPPGVLSVPYTPDVPGRDDFRWRAAPHRPVAGRTGRLRREAGRRRRDVVERGADRPRDRRRGGLADRVPAHRQLVHAAQQRADHRRGAGPTAGRLRGSCARPSTRRSTGSTTHQPRGPPSTTPADERRRFYETMWNSPGFMKLTSNYVDLLSNPEANAEWCEFIAAKVRGIVEDPATAERLIPTDHRFGEKRPPFVAGYYEAFNRPQRLARRPPGDADRAGHRRRGSRPPTASGEFDIIVWATGFDFGTGALARMGIVGRGGRGPGGPLGGRSPHLPRRADPRVPQPLLPRRPPRRRRQQPALQRRPGRLHHRPPRVMPGIGGFEVDRGHRAGRGALDRHDRPRRGVAVVVRREELLLRHEHPGEARCATCSTPPAGPKLFSVIADVVANDYDSFAFTRPRAGDVAPDGEAQGPARHTVATGRHRRAHDPGHPQRRGGEQEPAAPVLPQPASQLVEVPHLPERNARAGTGRGGGWGGRSAGSGRGPCRGAPRRRSCRPPEPAICESAIHSSSDGSRASR